MFPVRAQTTVCPSFIGRTTCRNATTGKWINVTFADQHINIDETVRQTSHMYGLHHRHPRTMLTEGGQQSAGRAGGLIEMLRIFNWPLFGKYQHCHITRLSQSNSPSTPWEGEFENSLFLILIYSKYNFSKFPNISLLSCPRHQK